MRARKAFLGKSLMLGLGLFLLNGCEDQQARTDAAQAQKELSTLKTEVTQLKAQLKQQQAALDSLPATLKNNLAQESVKLKKSLDDLQNDLTKKITENVTELRTSMQDQFKSTRRDFDRRLRNKISVDVAQNFQAVRKTIEKNRTELLGFMDKQLKELYPYAYQPRRMDPNAPPGKPRE